MLLSWSKGRKLWRWLLFTTISKNTWKEDWRFRRAWWTEVKREMWILVGSGTACVWKLYPFGHVTSSRSVMLKVCIICHRLVLAKIILSCVISATHAGPWVVRCVGVFLKGFRFMVKTLNAFVISLLWGNEIPASHCRKKTVKLLIKVHFWPLECCRCLVLALVLEDFVSID
jgi:hypothetical protein